MSEWELLGVMSIGVGAFMSCVLLSARLSRLERRLNHANAMRESMSNQVARLECKLVRLTKRLERIGVKDAD